MVRLAIRQAPNCTSKAHPEERARQEHRTPPPEKGWPKLAKRRKDKESGRVGKNTNRWEKMCDDNPCVEFYQEGCLGSDQMFKQVSEHVKPDRCVGVRFAQAFPKNFVGTL